MRKGKDLDILWVVLLAFAVYFAFWKHEELGIWFHRVIGSRNWTF